MILYNMVTIYQSWKKYSIIDFRVGQLVYKIDYFVTETPLSFLMLLNTRVYLLTLKT